MGCKVCGGGVKVISRSEVENQREENEIRTHTFMCTENSFKRRDDLDLSKEVSKKLRKLGYYIRVTKNNSDGSVNIRFKFPNGQSGGFCLFDDDIASITESLFAANGRCIADYYSLPKLKYG